jgi:hypothetical protein
LFLLSVCAMYTASCLADTPLPDVFATACSVPRGMAVAAAADSQMLRRPTSDVVPQVAELTAI